MPEVLDGGADDAGATGGTNDIVEGAVGVLDDCGGLRGEWAFEGADVTSGRWMVTEEVMDVGNGEA